MGDTLTDHCHTGPTLTPEGTEVKQGAGSPAKAETKAPGRAQCGEGEAGRPPGGNASEGGEDWRPRKPGLGGHLSCWLPLLSPPLRIFGALAPPPHPPQQLQSQPC